MANMIIGGMIAFIGVLIGAAITGMSQKKDV